MHNEDIYIEPNGLKEIIAKLTDDNKRILGVVDEINGLIKGIDDTVWSSPERKTVDDALIPYIDGKKQLIDTSLNNCTKVLQSALNRYLEADSNIKKASKELNTLEG